MSIHLAYFSTLNTSSPFPEDAGEVCITNISPAERQKRLRFGIRQLITTLVILAVLILFHLNPLWRLPLLFMFWAAATGYFQAHDKTWVSLASRGSRKFGENEEKIENQAELTQIRKQARQVIIKAFFAALALTLIAYLLPF